MATEQIGSVKRIRHPRTDFPQNGWLYKATVDGATNDLYETTTDYGWYTQTQTQSFRVDERTTGYGPCAKRTQQFYTDFPQQGWIDKVPGELWEAWYWPAIEASLDSSYRAESKRYTRPLGDW